MIDYAPQATALGTAGMLAHHASAFVSKYGVTGRCHNREFRFRFEKYRRMYRQYLFEATKRFNVRVLSWMVTLWETRPGCQPRRAKRA